MLIALVLLVTLSPSLYALVSATVRGIRERRAERRALERMRVSLRANAHRTVAVYHVRASARPHNLSRDLRRIRGDRYGRR